METELKLSIEPTQAAALAGHPLLEQLAVGKPRRQQLVSAYFDTADLRLKQHGLGLRVRRVGRRWIQTLKNEGSVTAGLHRRQEWESRVVGSHPELDALTGLPDQDAATAALLSEPGLAQQLVPIFTTRFARVVRLLRLPAGQQVEMAVDRGELLRGEIRQPISEVEFELKSGDASGLFDLALQLIDSVPMRLGNVSKAARGYALCAPEPWAPVKASRVEVDARMTVLQGLQVVVADCLAQIQGNEAGVMLSNDPESIHQMRVGLRRLRCALRLSGPLMPLPDAQRGELKWLARELGAARDREVLATGTLAAAIDACPQRVDLAPLQRAVSEDAKRHRQAASAAVGSVRYARLMLYLAGWALGARWCESRDAEDRRVLQAPLGAWAHERLAGCHARLLERGRRLKRATPARRHRLRIAAKQVRYATEFFQALYPSRPVARFVARLAAAQELLGWLNDAVVGARLLRGLADSQPVLAAPAHFAAGWLAGRNEADLRRLRKRWTRLVRTRLPWAR